MSLIAKAKASSGNLKEAFKNEAGAIDLASIMVGIIVIGLIGGVIAATVFAVIPWAQDNAAKQQLDSVASAQSAYIGLSSDKGNARFGGSFVQAVTQPDGSSGYNFSQTTSIGGGSDTISPQALFNAPSGSKVSIGWWGLGNQAHYAAAVKSASGKTFYISDAKTQPTQELSGSTGVASTNEVKAVVDTVKNL